jgi:SAM-dependent methyltransferase
MKNTDQFPFLYHAHHSLNLEDLPFWLKLAAQQGSPILELGCGTGRVLLPLAEGGYRLFGLDRDSGMLSVLQDRLPAGLKPGISLVQADLTQIPLVGRFALVLLPCNTFSTLTKDGRRACLNGVRKTLASGGVFAVSLPNPKLLRRQPRRSGPEMEEVFSHPLDGEPVQVSSAWKRTRDWFELSWYYDHLLPDGQVERLVARVNHSLASFEELRGEFHSYGLEVVETYGDFLGSAYTADSESLIILARKNEN